MGIKHTPPKWWLSPSGEILKMPEQIKIANGNVIWGATMEESKANRVLISKSPEMYELLCDVRSDYKDGLSEGTINAIESLLKDIEEKQ